MAAILENLRLDDRHKTILLTNGTVSGERVGSLTDCKLRWKAVTNLEDSSPLSKTAAHFVIFSTSLSEAVKALSGGLFICAANDLKALVDFDAAVDATRAEQIAESFTILAAVSDSLVEHDDATNVLFNLGGSEQ